MTEFKQILTPRDRTLFHKNNKTNKWGFVGVKFKKKSGKFEAFIRGPSGKKLYCGRGSTPEEAARAYDVKSYSLYGNDAILNFPKGEE